jgi:WhiB family redox-sensing transcriptional regulator
MSRPAPTGSSHGLTSPRAASWRDRALCDGTDPSLFFPEPGVHSMRDAKQVCALCPVRLECLEHALSMPEQYGVWGGMTEKELAEMRRRRRRQTAA